MSEHTVRFQRSRAGFGLVARCSCETWLSAGSESYVRELADRHLESVTLGALREQEEDEQ